MKIAKSACVASGSAKISGVYGGGVNQWPGDIVMDSVNVVAYQTALAKLGASRNIASRDSARIKRSASAHQHRAGAPSKTPAWRGCSSSNVSLGGAQTWRHARVDIIGARHVARRKHGTGVARRGAATRAGIFGRNVNTPPAWRNASR